MSETTADTATTTDTTATDTQTTDTAVTDWEAEAKKHAAEAEKFKGLHRKQEERAKANAQAAKELEQLRASTMSETEKAVAEAKAAGRAEALREAGSKLVDAEVRASAAGRNIDIDALLEGLDRGRFLTDDGDADREAISAWVDKVAPKASGTPDGFPPPPDLGQGARSSTPIGDDAAFLRMLDDITK